MGDATRDRLRNVYWIGGGSGAGKSTIARRVARQHGLRLADGPGVVAEGFRLLPGLVQPLLARPSHAVWLLPTPRFRHAALRSRGTLWQIAGKTSEPNRALANILERDRMFTERLREEAEGRGLPVLEIDLSLTEDDLAERVTNMFGLK